MAVYALGDSVPEIHPDAYVHPEATVIGAVRIGAGSTVWPQAVLRGDYAKLHKATDWEPEIDIIDGTLRDILDEWRQRVGR